MLINNIKKTYRIGRFLFVILLLMCGGIAVHAQAPDAKVAPAPAPTPAEDAVFNGYRVSGSAEIGYRWRSVTGNLDTYRSHLNYSQGLRSFDGSILMESVNGKGQYFDSFLVTNSGWGSDPSGSTRVNVEKVGIYKFNAAVRKVNYFNQIQYFVAVPVPYQHSQQTKNTMGDFDFTFLPQNRLIRLTLGMSFGNYKGPGTATERESGDEFSTPADWKQQTRDYRMGLEGTLAGFDWNFTEGYRHYRERSNYQISSTNLGNAIAGTALETLFSRYFPSDGTTNFTQFGIHRTFAEKVDFTGRFIYSNLESENTLNENHVGRDASNNFVDQDLYTSIGSAKRPQTRADLGATYAITNNFRLSNTFTFDQFNVNSGNVFTQDLTSRTPAGVPRPTTIARTLAYRVEGLRRFMNTLEGDYQFNNHISLHLGWRYSKRRVQEAGYDFNQVTSAYTTVPYATESHNTTNSLIAGMKIKPLTGWTIYWDLEHGQADNVFSRLENYNFTNYRVRTRYTYKTVSLNFSGISKNDSNPSLTSTTLPPSLNYVTNIKTRSFDGTVTWDPTTRVNVAGGYSYRWVTSYTPVIFPYQVCTTPACTAGTSVNNFAYSQYFIRDHYGYIEVSARLTPRVSLYGAYRIDKDLGQGDQTSPILPSTFPVQPTGLPVYQNIIGSYPMSFTSPEFRTVFRITRKIDWSIGYQYYKYNDVKVPVQNYRASLPYTSLRIYFGNPPGDR